MISSLWTLCQACPSVSAGKLDGKYRWTEYRDVPTTERVIEQAPQCSGHSVTESSTRVRKDAVDGAGQQPDSSGVVHDFMEPTLALPAHLKFDNQLYLQVLRRSQSEGPHRGVHGSVGAGVAAFEPGPMAAWVHGRRRHVTDQQRPEHWFSGAAAASGSSAESRAPLHEHQKRVVVAAGETSRRITGSSEYQLQFAWPAGKQSRRMPESLDSLLCHDGPAEREAAGLLSHNQNRINAGTRSQEVVYQATDELLPHHQPNDANDSNQPTRRRRYKTEYKKKFRPFSLYQYVDGRFQKSSSEKIPSSTETSHGGQQQQPDKDTWYGEVLELRKKAGEYKYRGLGGELMPQHMADLYAKQFDVWEQVSRRSSLSALALAATTPRPGSEKDSTAASSKRGSPIKMAPPNSSAARPGQAQLVLISSRKDNRNKAAESTERGRRDPSQHRSISAEGSKSRSKSAKPARSHSGHHHQQQQQQQQQQQISNVTAAIRQSVVQRTPARSASLGPERRMPKSSSSSGTGSNNKTTPVKARPAHNNQEGGEPVKVPRNHKTMPTDEGKENRIDDGPTDSSTVIDQEPLPALIKALPEPTRVKSPEQLVVRSPDPVNWTVPLDTGKTFTVTQNIRGGEGSRPHSELKVSMTVRPAAAPVHSTPTPAVKTEPAQTDEQQQQQQLVETPEKIPPPAPAPVGAPDDVATGSEENPATDDDVEMVAVESASPADEKLMEIDDEKPPSADEEVNSQPEKPADEIHEAQEKDKEEMVNEEENVKETRLPAQEEPNGLADDPLSAAVVLSKSSMTPKEETSTVAATPILPVTSIVPGTTLRRLEDPTPFLFSRPGTLGTLTGPATSLAEQMPKAPRYRVLEAPGMMSDPIHADTEQPQSSSSAAAAASSPNASPLTSRSLASDVLEKARTRFDRFWTKKDSDK